MISATTSASGWSSGRVRRPPGRVSPGSTGWEWRSAYGDGVHPGVGAHGVLPQREARRLGILLARDVLAHCRRLVVTRPSDATLADLDAALADRAKIHLAGAEPAAVADALYEMVICRSPL